MLLYKSLLKNLKKLHECNQSNNNFSAFLFAKCQNAWSGTQQSSMLFPSPTSSQALSSQDPTQNLRKY